MQKKTFFIPLIGKNHEKRLVVLATMFCPHTGCKFWEDCTSGNSRAHNTECKHPNDKGRYKNLDTSLLYQKHLFLDDKYEEYGESKNKTFPVLTNAIAEALQLDATNDKQKIWDMFICTELCQHFTKQKQTLESDFHIEDYEALLELIDKYDIDRVLVCGSPGFKFIRKNSSCQFTWKEAFLDAWHHKLIRNGKEIDIIYSYHPSYSGYYARDENGNSTLIHVLKLFFSDKPIHIDLD